jgi:uroporphyrin-III C-methyltransferase / precorrin-2 dehydrogenase / sirohydrochlorin ferrochelatase
VSGRVTLVGAGPGDPGLLTRRAVAVLRRADLVLYDALVPGAVLHIARRARRFYVGKRAGRHSISQDGINRLMIRAARRGEHVVRLKSGDPFVFGRGGEEALALKAAGIPVTVVPGVSAALAAPALSGIPVTHRGISAAFVTVSGHAASAYRPVLESLPPGAATIVVLMGLAQREAITRLLIDRAWAGETPAAIVLDASQPGMQLWLGTLDELSRLAWDTCDAAGTIVIGEVVSLAEVLAPATVTTITQAPATPASAVGAAGQSAQSIEPRNLRSVLSTMKSVR